MKFSKKLEKIPPYLFAEIEKTLDKKKEEGIDVISFGIGDPDIPTPDFILQAMWDSSRDPANHQYPSYFGLPELREAIARWMKKRFDVNLDPKNEIIPLIGSKEGIAHIALALIDPGDIALVPEPCYPVYEMGTLLAGGDVRFLPMQPENGFKPVLDEVSWQTAVDAKIMWVNYPNNPTGAVVDLDYYDEIVRFGLENDIIIASDNAYCEITFDGFRAPSLLQSRGAMDIGIEFFSLSKSYNMSGWRLGFACGNRNIIEAMGTVKTNIDSGIFNPLQIAAICALDKGDVFLEEVRERYKKRRDFIVDELRGLGWNVNVPKGSIYIWMPVPDGYDSVGFSTEVLEKANVFFTPGTGYGPSGEGFVRISLTTPDDRIEEAIGRLKEVF